MTVCTFAGHREVFSSTVESEIDKALIEIIEADKECVFYSGGMGDFDKKCESAVRGMRKKVSRTKYSPCAGSPLSDP